MTPPEYFLATLGVILFFGLLLPQLLQPLRLPFASALILVGSVMGPHGLGYVESDENLVLFGFLGAMFQMLLAGTEARTLSVEPDNRNVAKLLLLNGFLPAATGIIIGRVFGYEWASALFLGIVFLSSSILITSGMIEAAGFNMTGVGRLTKRVVAIEDLGASVLAFLLFQALEPQNRFPLPILAGLLLSSVILLRMFVPEVVAFFFRHIDERGEEHEGRLRLVIALLLLVIFGYSLLDVHPVLSAFLVGFTLAGVPEVTEIGNRLEVLGYGLFIPVFLFVIGIETDLSILWRLDLANVLVTTLVLAAIGTKLLGGYLGAKWAGYGSRDASVAAVSATAKLAVPLSITYAAHDLGILDEELFSAIVITAVATTILAPLLLIRFRPKPFEASE